MHEGQLDLAEPTLEPASEAITSAEPVSVFDAQLIVVEVAQPVQVEVDPMQVDDAEVKDHQNVSLGVDTEVRISPLEVTLALKRALSCLSQPPPL